MENRISNALLKLFDRGHRIVFWYDTECRLIDDFQTVELPGVEKVEIKNNEYGIKHLILRQKPDQKFLLYKAGPQPEKRVDNWLLDVQLANAEFRTDQESIWLSELELGSDLAEVVRNHLEFYQASKRRDALKKLVRPDDAADSIRLKMLAVIVGCEARIDSVLELLLQELADGRDEKIKLMGRCGLDSFLWEKMERIYGYRSAEPGIKDFAVELFSSCFALGTNGDVKLTGDALVFLKRWKDSRTFESSFKTLSQECQDALGIEDRLAEMDFRDLLEVDYFRLIDGKIISDLVKAVVARTVSGSDVSSWVRQRRSGHWFDGFQDVYEAIDYAGRFLAVMDEVKLTMDSLYNGVELYARSWFQLDQYYRKFIYHMGKSGQASLLKDLNEKIENQYVNSYLLKVNDRWQAFVDAAQRWGVPLVTLQKDFFETFVRPFLNKDNKVCVIISDAFRFEAGDELLTLVCREDRYEASLKPMLSMLPSYTQLGMAALLPHKNLEITADQSGSVLVDGQSSSGIANRDKILDKAMAKRGIVLKSEDVMILNKDDCRALIRDHDVVYVYHDRIDSTGDKRESEEHTAEAVEDTLKDLILLIKKLTAANASNLIVTADHGFIYQNRPIADSDFSGGDAHGDHITYRNRRFVLGKGLKASSSLRKFESSALRLAGDLEVLIPKSINRLRLQGSGSRFVHGGASLQEVVIPVVCINKKRQSDVSKVEVSILRGESSVITSGQVVVSFYQAQPVTDKVQKRVMQAGIYTESGELISACQDLEFALTSENPREREMQVRFVLTRKADEANGQEVVLKLKEKIAGTSHYTEYSSLRYTMRRSFTSDFDF